MIEAHSGAALERVALENARLTAPSATEVIGADAVMQGSTTPFHKSDQGKAEL
jgi:hypothetical protein